MGRRVRLRVRAGPLRRGRAGLFVPRRTDSGPQQPDRSCQSMVISGIVTMQKITVMMLIVPV